MKFLNPCMGYGALVPYAARRYGPMLARYAAGAFAGYAKRKAGEYFASGAKRFKPGNGSPRKKEINRITSFQHDVTNLYRRKRAPRRVRSRARKGMKNFNTKYMKTLGQRTYNVSSVNSMTVTAASALSVGQAVTSVCIYGGEAGATNGYADLWNIVNGVATGVAVDSKILFKSAVLDLQIRNDETSVACVDIYEFVCRKDCITKCDGAWVDAMANQTALYGGSKALTTLVGCTPFDGPGFGSFYLITKTTRTRIAPGSSVYLQKRDPKNWMFDTSRMQSTGSPGVAKLEEFKGMTKGYLIVARSADVEDTSPPTIGAVDLKIYTQRSYHWVQMEDAQDNQGFAID